MKKENEAYSIVLCTTGNSSDTQKIVSELLQKKLAACVQIQKINSHYIWEGKLMNEEEDLLAIKCRTADYTLIQSAIKKNHSYRVPQIIQVPISNGLPEYLNWIKNETEK